jgi:hypothetical protein
MALRNAVPLTFRAHGLSDAIDGTNVFPGAMAQLQNLVPAPHTKGVFVPRPAALLEYNFSDFATPANGELIYVNGTRQYGFIQSARFAGKSEPFIYDTATAAFVSISGVTSSNCPTSTSNTGDWTPPTADRIGSRVVFTHPGFPGGTTKFGWLDMSSFSDNTHTGNTHTSTTVDTLSTNVLLLGWRPGMTISSSAADIPAGTRIVSIASGGLSLTLSAAATGTNAGVTLTVAGGTAASPLWAAGDVDLNPLAATPVFVRQFFGRAYYGVNNAVEYSDVGDPLTKTNASQVITFQNGLAVNAAIATSLYQTTGGILAALYVFQGAMSIQQITGDAALSTLTVNQVSQTAGTQAPNSICSCPKGILFMDHDGVRLVDSYGNVSDPIGADGSGVVVPFQNAVHPSRVCASYNGGVFRISLDSNLSAGGIVGTIVQRQEFWFHFPEQAWTGPHTFPPSLIAASDIDQNFVLFPQLGGPLGLWLSNTLPTQSTIYTENGATMAFAWATCLLPDTDRMAENAMVETVISISIPALSLATAYFFNEDSVALGTVTLVGGAVGPALWGTAIWGVAIWGTAGTRLRQTRLPWAAPLVFKQGQLVISGDCGGLTAIGNLYMKYQVLGYLMQGAANAV